jgi:D-aminopeptidase
MTKARQIGIPFDGRTSPYNAITDVNGTLVGQVTLIPGEGPLIVGRGPVRTGVTAVLPRGYDDDPVFAGWYSLNGCGEMTGTTWIEEAGFLQGPVMITNTHSVGTVHDAVIAWTRRRPNFDPTDLRTFWSLPVVAETYDGRLNDINGFHVREHHVFEALDSAVSGPVAEGNVGGGTGMVCHGFKGGIGSASRLVTCAGETYTLGVLVQANHGAREHLTIAGVPVGREITDLRPQWNDAPSAGTLEAGSGSVIVVVATDAPLLPHQLKRLARRVPIGIGKVGGIGHNYSGDIFIAYSTANPGAANPGAVNPGAANPGADGPISRLAMLSPQVISPLFEATIQATEEAIVNALVAAETMVGINGSTVYALPQDRLLAVLAQYGRL